MLPRTGWSVGLLSSSLVWLAGCAALSGAYAEDALDVLQARIIHVSESIKPAVIHVEAAVRQNNRRNVVTGSGFVVDADGIALTNHHVVERAEKVTVRVPGRAGRYTAEVLGYDKQTDLAVLRIHPHEAGEKFPIAPPGDSDKLSVGEWVIAIGNPYGLDGTVSLGIVSAKGRDLEAENLLNDFIQTDAMIDRGSSGGPLVNLKGEVVGINSRGQGRGIGFTIPMNTARRIMADLLGGGRIARGYVGIVIQPLDRELASYWDIPEVHGVVINGVFQGSPAEQAGIRVGDIVTRIAGQAVAAEKDEDLGEFQRRIATTPVGEEVELEVFRDGNMHVLSTQLGSQPQVVPAEEETEYGFTVQEITAVLFRTHRLDRREGVLVSFVERGSEAAEAGLMNGDLIFRLDKVEVSDLESFREGIDQLDGSQPFLIEARRGFDTRFLLIVPRLPPERSTRSKETEAPKGSEPAS